MDTAFGESLAGAWLVAVGTIKQLPLGEDIVRLIAVCEDSEVLIESSCAKNGSGGSASVLIRDWERNTCEACFTPECISRFSRLWLRYNQFTHTSSIVSDQNYPSPAMEWGE